MVLENPKTGQVYEFELKDRVIRDDELDGWKEIPVKPNAEPNVEGSDDPGAKDEFDAEAKSLPGKPAVLFVIVTLVRSVVHRIVR